MRTTLTIDDDVLAAAKELAARERRSVGEILSDLARRSLQREAPSRERNGIPLLPLREPGTIVTPDLVNRLRDELP
jgi:hypothetical protein